MAAATDDDDDDDLFSSLVSLIFHNPSVESTSVPELFACVCQGQKCDSLLQLCVGTSRKSLRIESTSMLS